MSQITFTGPASGTGTVNISAPVTNTERNLTLPDMSGTITAASSGTADATTFLRGDGAWAVAGSPPGTVELLQEDTFTTSGTWTKAAGFDADDTVMVFLVGGGGGGGATYVTTNDGVAMGGAPGQSHILYAKYADVPSSANFTVGAGGAGVTRTTAGPTGLNSATSGGDTVLSTTKLFVTAYGGTGGAYEAGRSKLDTDPSYWTVVGSLVEYIRINNNSISSVYPGIGAVAISRNIRPATSALANDFSVTSDVAPASYLQIFQPGGSGARAGATNRDFWNQAQPAVFEGGGAGSGTANAENATAIGCGGGGCVRQNATAVGGNGFAGGMVVRYYRGRVSPFQILSGSST